MDPYEVGLQQETNTSKKTCYVILCITRDASPCIVSEEQQEPNARPYQSLVTQSAATQQEQTGY